jgi:aarF domain-containing kinase
LTYILYLASGVQLKDGAGDECAAAVAILLFGSSTTVLPGGYAGEEVSPLSPIVQVQEFPNEFILLGRATVMIRGIASRLGIPWGLAERWAKVAQVAVDATDPGEVMPIWSVVPPTMATTSTVPRRSAGKVRARDVQSALLSCIQLTQVTYRAGMV